MSKETDDFLSCAFAALVLRGYDRERDIEDPILRGVWRHGKKLAKKLKPLKGVSVRKP